MSIVFHLMEHISFLGDLGSGPGIYNPHAPNNLDRILVADRK